MAEGPYQTRHSGPQPTALTSSRVDLSPASSRASAAGRRAFRRAYRVGGMRACLDCGSYPCRCVRTVDTSPTPLYQDCACGEGLTASTPLPTDIIYAVATHNQRPAHKAWRTRMGL